MSILIKGMKMPQKEGDYDARLHVNRDGTALFYLYKGPGVHVAKELPPHGRLIDADAVCKRIADNIRKYHTEGSGGYYLAEDALEEVKFAETVLEGDKDAEEEGE